MYHRMMYHASITRPGKSNLTCNARAFSVVALFLALAVLATPALASHENDCIGGAPLCTFTTTRIIEVGSGWKTGRQVKVELSADDASDSDEHWNGSSYVSDDDTFDNAGAYKWTITALVSSPLNLTGQSVNFTTKNGLGSGTISLKIKDDGIHFQDYGSNTEVASLYVTIVDPDGIRIVSHSGSIVVNDAIEVYAETPVVWQLTYSGEDLPWSGEVEEQITWPLTSYRNVSPATPQTISGTFTDIIAWTPGSEDNGRFTDNHWSSFPKPLPTGGNYHVLANHQKFKNNEAGGAFFGATFTDYEYIDSTPAFTHDEQ